MNKIVAGIVAILIVVVIGAYFFFVGKEYVVKLSEPDIQAKLQEKLPLTKTYLFIIQVTLDNPRVNLENGSNKVKAGLDILFNITLNKVPKPLGGEVDISGGVLYLAEKGQFFLTNPIIENLKVQGIPQEYTDKVNKALSKALAEYYKEHPIYTLRATDVKQAAARLILKNVIIKNKELIITLGI